MKRRAPSAPVSCRSTAIRRRYRLSTNTKILSVVFLLGINIGIVWRLASSFLPRQLLSLSPLTQSKPAHVAPTLRQCHNATVPRISTTSFSTACAEISVIVPTTPDHWKHLPRLLQSLALNTRPPCEVVVAASSVAANWQQLLPPQLMSPAVNSLNIRILTSSKRQNAAQNRNRAVQAANYSVIANLDSDDVASPLWIETVERMFLLKNERSILEEGVSNIDFMVHPWFWLKHGPPCTLQRPTEHDVLSLNRLLHLMTSVGRIQSHEEEHDGPLTSSRNLNKFNATTPVSPKQVFDWVCCDYYHHPAFHNAHIAVRKHVWEAVQGQRIEAEYERKEDAWFVTDLLLETYVGIFVNQQLTGYDSKPRGIELAVVRDLQTFYQRATAALPMAAMAKDQMSSVATQ